MANQRPATAIVAVVAERTLERARTVAAAAEKDADLLEWRLDTLEETPDPAAFLAGRKRPVIATWRLPADGGARALGAKSRLELLAQCARAGAAWLDLEAGTRVPEDIGDARVLRSLHVKEGDGLSAEAALARVEEETGDALKVVLPAGDAAPGLRALELLRRRPADSRPLTLFSAGRRGTATRLLGAVLGNALLYVAAREGIPPAPGMPTLREVVDGYRIGRVRPGSRFVALLGGDLARSPSARAFNAALDGVGSRTLYVPVSCDDGEGAARALLDLGAHGLAFTRPHKGVAARVADARGGSAVRTGVANTLARIEEILFATDTDGAVVVNMAHELLGGPLDGKVIVILGAGGTAREVAATLSHLGATVHLVARDPQAAVEAAALCDASAAAPPREAALLVNATPVGQIGESLEDPAAVLAPRVRAEARIDVTYGSDETAFLRAVQPQRRGTGARMLREQATLQWDLWGFGDEEDAKEVPPLRRDRSRQPSKEVERALPERSPVLHIGRIATHASLSREFERALEFDRRRIVLLGMRGSGKTAVGEALAAATGRPLRDTDAMVESRTGRRVYDIFREDGEAAFRALEAAAVEEAHAVPGAVVVLGGGAVLHLPTKPTDAWMVRLRARPETLGRRLRDSGRPSLLGRPPENEVADLLRAREPIYEALTDFAVDTDDSTPEEAAGEVLTRLRQGFSGGGAAGR